MRPLVKGALSDRERAPRNSLRGVARGFFIGNWVAGTGNGLAGIVARAVTRGGQASSLWSPEPPHDSTGWLRTARNPPCSLKGREHHVPRIVLLRSRIPRQKRAPRTVASDPRHGPASTDRHPRADQVPQGRTARPQNQSGQQEPRPRQRQAATDRPQVPREAAHRSDSERVMKPARSRNAISRGLKQKLTAYEKGSITGLEMRGILLDAAADVRREAFASMRQLPLIVK